MNSDIDLGMPLKTSGVNVIRVRPEYDHAQDLVIHVGCVANRWRKVRIVIDGSLEEPEIEHKK